ncbi:hypothetical protein FACS189499_04900 [Clostridia bacterium]|nr:hypothetical protein FACS189499_04900 [Clostridia bacterium]
MNNKATSFLMFVVGAAVGSIATWQLIKKKYEQIAQDEIDSVKEAFSKREPAVAEVTDNIDARTKAEQAKEKPDVAEYTAKLREYGYTAYLNTNTRNQKKPYVIPPEEFGEIEGYEKIGISYYADQVLADENDELIEDVENVVGFESLSHFGEFEDDSVFVRNNRLKCDYEILLDQRKYSDVVKRKPHQVEE